MRKINPQDVRQDFNQSLVEQLDFFGRLSAFGLASGDRKRLAEQVFFVSASLWEGFISDLFVGYVNVDSSTLTAKISNDIAQSTRAKFGTFAASKTAVSFPQHIRAADAAALLDKDGYNVTFPSARKMVAEAGTVLMPAHRVGFVGLSPGDLDAIDAWKETRNCIAHRSESSFERMNAALAKSDLATAYPQLARGVHAIEDVGSFLDATPVGSTQKRLVQFINTMTTIASRL